MAQQTGLGPAEHSSEHHSLNSRHIKDHLEATKDALAAKKARGAQLGTPANLTDVARQQSLLVRRAHIQQHPGLRQTAAFIASRRAQGVSFRQLAGELNALGFTAPRGGTFNQKQVQRLHKRLPIVGKHTAVE